MLVTGLLRGGSLPGTGPRRMGAGPGGQLQGAVARSFPTKGSSLTAGVGSRIRRGSSVLFFTWEKLMGVCMVE